MPVLECHLVEGQFSEAQQAELLHRSAQTYAEVLAAWRWRVGRWRSVKP